MHISIIDLIIFWAYCLLILFVGLFVSRKSQKEMQSAKGYFWLEGDCLGGQ